jgi:hypothetical protein
MQFDNGFFIADSAAPQSAHTYDNNIFAPLNDLFFSLGGATFNSGADFSNRAADGALVRAGPWAWDPTRADPNKVGGTTGSGYNPATVGGQMWSNQQGKWTGQEVPSYINGNSAYRAEGGAMFSTFRAIKTRRGGPHCIDTNSATCEQDNPAVSTGWRSPETFRAFKA